MSRFDTYRDAFPNVRLTLGYWNWRFTPMAIR
jgi:hypothetical protein